jgi:chemotaxis protein methyltransferase CheR
VIVARGADVPPIASQATTDLELQLLLEAVHRVSGYDFREYAPAVVKRRVADRVRGENVGTISGLQEAILHRPHAMDRFVDAVSFNPSTPFADPDFFADVRALVLPRLRTFPFVRVWVAGCGSGDDAYSLAILFHEAEVAHRVRIYATDATDAAVERARLGQLPAVELEDYQRRYAAAGGLGRFSDYVDLAGTQLTYRDPARANIVFAQHNLAMDGSFNEFHLILVRNALALFNRTLAYHAHQVIFESLVRLGILGLGGRDSMRYTPHQRAYESLPDTESGAFFRRVR